MHWGLKENMVFFWQFGQAFIVFVVVGIDTKLIVILKNWLRSVKVLLGRCKVLFMFLTLSKTDRLTHHTYIIVRNKWDEKNKALGLNSYGVLLPSPQKLFSW